jgi:hypothetical protein
LELPFPIPLKANIKSFSPRKMLSAEEAMEKILTGIASAQVRKEVNKWYLFGLQGGGKDLKKLSPEELGFFMDKLSDIALVLYNFHQPIEEIR